MTRGIETFFVALALVTMSPAAWPAETSKTPPKKSEVAPAVAKPKAPAVPDDYKLTMLIRTTLIALSQANATGNYSVLRDLAAPDFQQANNQAKLTDIFANIRNKHVDLSPTLFYAPQLVRPPAIEASGLLRLSGLIPTKPEQVSFDLAFQPIGDDWRLYGIAVDIGPSAALVRPDQPPATPETPSKPAPSSASAKSSGGKASKPSANPIVKQ